jgi:PR domain zinc finger protein 5
LSSILIHNRDTINAISIVCKDVISKRIFSFLGDEDGMNEIFIKIDDGPRIAKVETVSDSNDKNAIVGKTANRSSAMALIVNTANSCPFKYNVTSFLCLYCNERYAELQPLHQHTAYFHQNITESDIKKALVKTNKDQKVKINFTAFVCKICDTSFFNYKEMKVHIKQEHGKPVDVEDDGVLPFKILNGIYECPLCGTAFRNYLALNKHVNSHFPYLICKQCGAGCSTTQRLRQHMTTHADRSHSCETCLKTFPTAARKKEHFTRVHLKQQKNKCPLCPEIFTKYREKVKHLKVVHGKKLLCYEKESKKTVGSYRSKSALIFKSLLSLRHHLAWCTTAKAVLAVSQFTYTVLCYNNNKQDSIRNCFILGKLVLNQFLFLGDTSVGFIPIRPMDAKKLKDNSSIIFQSSEQTQTTRDSAVAIILNSNVCPFKFNGQYMCLYCTSQFIGMPELVVHTAAEHPNLTERDIKRAVVRSAKTIPVKINVMNFTCNICNSELTDFDDLKHHLIGKHKKYVDLKSDGVMAYSITESEYICVYCGVKFQNYRLLNKHINDKHYNTFICDQCGVGFASKYRLQSHTISHTPGDYPCDFCGKMYRSIWSKRHHVKVDHLKIKLNKCTHCSEMFKDYNQKLKHIAAVHGKKRFEYKCSLCPKIFMTNSNLRSHERVFHEKGHKFICDNCNYETYSKHLLKHHMICHSDEKNYKCLVCGKSYARRYTLTEHMKIHNNDRRHVCQYCGKAFVQKCSLKGHLKTHHRDVENMEY